jgi:acyl-homoserine lactone acylase PvdQ
MSEEVEKKEETKSFKDFIGSQDYIDHINGLKGEWGKKRDEDFAAKENDLRKSLRDDIMKELNPEETPEQKQIRELMEYKAATEKEKQINERKSALRNVAKEIEFDPIKAERYVAYGDKAEEYMKQDAEWLKSSIAAALDGKVKETYDTKTPKQDEQPSVNDDFEARMKNLTSKL